MAIYAAYRTSQPPDYRTYSPEVTSLRSNLPVHRSVCAQKGFHHADLIIISDIQRNVKTFFSVFHSFLKFFWQYADAHGSGANVPLRAISRSGISFRSGRLRILYGVSIRHKRTPGCYAPRCSLLYMSSDTQLGLQCGDHLLILSVLQVYRLRVGDGKSPAELKAALILGDDMEMQMGIRVAKGAQVQLRAAPTAP